MQRARTAITGLTLLVMGLWGTDSRADLGKYACVLTWEGIPGSPSRVPETEAAFITRIDCTDGDPSCDADGNIDGSCRLAPRLCVNQPNDDACVLGPVESLRVKPYEVLAVGELNNRKGTVVSPLVPPGDLSGIAECGAAAQIDVPLRSGSTGYRKSKRVRLRSSSRVPKASSSISYACHPSTHIAPCAQNPSDGPDQVRLRISGTGDIDLGWTGVGFNVPNTVGTEAIACLSGCDQANDPTCEVHGPAGYSTLNGPAFGPPLPLLAGGIPICLKNRYKGPITGTANLQTGEVDAVIPLDVVVFLTTPESVCPRCSGENVGELGICDSGPRLGEACTTESIATVPGATGSPTYRLSRDCPPGPSGSRNDQNLGTLHVPLPITTGTSSSDDVDGPGPGFPTPCTDKSLAPAAPDPQPDACTGACDTPCTGIACATMVDGFCIDLKGGISQLCCSDDSTRPCHPVASGPLTRTGDATPPMPAWPDSTYPKTGPLTAVGVFCASATTTNALNLPVGMPGPGAHVMPMLQSYENVPAPE